MTPRIRVCTLVILIVSVVLTPFATAADAAKPKIRAVTAFVRVDRDQLESQVADALTVLRKAKSAIEQAGYEVEGVRIVTQPFSVYTRGMSKIDALELLRRFDALAAKEKFDPNIGPAMLRDSDDPAAVELLADALSTTKLNASLIIAGEDGIHWKSISAAAKLIKTVAERSPHSQGNFGFAATAMLQPFGPFYPGAYHSSEGRRFAVALESANVVEQAFTGANDAESGSKRLLAALTPHLRAVEAVAQRIERETRWTYMGIDPTPAPFNEVSIGSAIEKLTGRKFGASGTLSAAAAITRAVQAVPVKRVGYSGLMLPVMEDTLLAQRWTEGAYNIDSILAYSAVCGAGLDTIPLPGDITQEQIENILADVASLAVKWNKPLSARLLPVAGKKAGDRTEFDDPFLVNTTIPVLP